MRLQLANILEQSTRNGTVVEDPQSLLQHHHPLDEPPGFPTREEGCEEFRSVAKSLAVKPDRVQHVGREPAYVIAH